MLSNNIVNISSPKIVYVPFMKSKPRKALSIEENLRNVNHAQVSYSLNKQKHIVPRLLSVMDKNFISLLSKHYLDNDHKLCQSERNADMQIVGEALKISC